MHLDETYDQLMKCLTDMLRALIMAQGDTDSLEKNQP